MKISVIVPVYKVERYLRRCVDSILAQTYRDFELILVDDGSPDNCGKICDEYARMDDRIHVVHLEKNSGLFYVRSVGIDHAHGDWIAFVDSDDYIDKDRLDVLIREGERAGADAVWGDVVSLNSVTGQCSYHPYSDLIFRSKPVDGQWAYNRLLSFRGRDFEWHVVWGKIYRREIAIRARSIFKECTKHLVMCEDVAWSVALMGGVEKLAFAHGAPYFYFRNESASTTSTDVSHDRLFKVASDFNLSCEYASEATKLSIQNEDRTADVRLWISRYASPWRGRSVGLHSDVVKLLDAVIVKDAKYGFCSDDISANLQAEDLQHVARCARRYRINKHVKDVARVCFYPLVLVRRYIRKHI